MATEEPALVVKVAWLHKLKNLKDDDNSSDSDSSSNSGSASDRSRPAATPQSLTVSLTVGEKSTNNDAPSPQKQQRRSSRVPPVTKKKATSPKKKKKKKTVTVKKKEKVAPSDVESESGSSDGSGRDSSSEGDDKTEEKERIRKEKKKKSSSSKMTRVASQRDRRAKEPTAKKSTAAEVVMRNKSDRKVFEKVTKTLVKKEAIVKKVKVKKKFVVANDSSNSDSGSGSDSSGSDSGESIKKKKKDARRSRTANAPSPSVIRKREITAKERADRTPLRVHSVEKTESAIAKESHADPGTKRVKALILNKGSEYEVARSRLNSASRKRPLPGTPSRSENEEVTVERKKLSSSGRDRSPKEKERRDAKASSSSVNESVAESLPREKENPSRDAPKKKKKKELTQEEQDRRLALALASRKSDRPRRRTGSEDTLESVKRDPVAVIAADVRLQKRKRVEAIATSPSAVSSAIETSETPKAKPVKKLRKASVDADSAHVDDSGKTIEKQKPVKRLRKSSDENVGVAAAVKKPSAAEKLTPTKRAVRKASSDLGDTTSGHNREEPKSVHSTTPRGDREELKSMRSRTPRKERERNEAPSKEKREQKRAPGVEDEGERKVKVESGVEKKESRRVKSVAGTENEAVRKKKLVLGTETEEATGKMKVELGAGEAGAEKEAAQNVKTEPKTCGDPDEPATEQRAIDADSVVEAAMTSDAVKSEPTVSENDVKISAHADELTVSEEMKREPVAQTTGDDAADLVTKKQESDELDGQKAKPRKVSSASDGDKEEGEEGEEGAVLEEPVATSTVPAKVEALDDIKEEKADNSVNKPVEDPVDSMSFVIPKKKFKKADEPSSTRAPATSSMPPRINASIRRTPASSPLPRDAEGSNGSAGNSGVPDERADSRRRRRKKNPVPLATPPLTREEKEFTRLAKRMNSIVEACRKVHAATGGFKTSATVGPYDVVDSNGGVIPDFIPRMKCPTKKQMKTQTDQFPSPFFGVSMTLPTAAPTEDSSSPDQPDVSSKVDVLKTEINSYEQLVFERPEDRDAYQKKMYGTTFVPQLLRGRTTLIMRNVRYERKSTGFQFNTDRDREDFSKELSERYTMNKTVPRCDIPPKNWQQLVKKVPAVLYLHYMNREDGELATQRFVDDNGAPLERKRTDRFGAIISAGNSPAPQLTPRRSRSIERSGPESSPVVSRKDNDSHDSVPGARGWQPYHDEQRSNGRRGDRNGLCSRRGSREWPPRYRDRGGAYNSSDSRGDRRQDQVERERSDRPADQRYGARDIERNDDQLMRRRPRSRTRSRSRPRVQSQPVREYDENYWLSDGGEMDAGRRDGNRDFSDHHHGSQANSAEEDGGDRRDLVPRQDEREKRSQPYSKVEENSSQRSNDRRDDFDRRDRARSESLGKENRDYSSDAKTQRSNHGDDVDMEEGRSQYEHVESERDAGRSRSPEQERADRVHEENEEDRTSRRDFDDDNQQHSSESFESNPRDDPYYRNGRGIDNRGDDRAFHNGEHEYGRRNHHPRRYSRSRSRSHPRQPHLNQPDRSDHDRARVAHYERHFGHGRDGGHFRGEFDDNNGFNYHHDDRERDRAYHRNGRRGGDEYAHQRNHPY